MSNIEQTSLWRQTLSEEINDEYRSKRVELASVLRGMRRVVQGLVNEISGSCSGLTVHDVTHLDALWETADEIVGKDYKINPVEAFVFGASVLMHDTALALVAYPGGESAIRATTEWKDMEGAFRRKLTLEDKERSLSSVEVELITFQVLRRLHAAQAEKLAVQSWARGTTGVVYLLDNLELRQAYGRSIGKIAHSHHWGIDRVATEMRNGLGASPDLPAHWTLNELKIACMLRCADIAHIDRRRAPTLLYLAKALGERSEEHWSFQNRLNRPALKDEALVFASGEDFPLNQSEAWWLSYGAICDIDKEIRSSNAVLAEQGLEQFAAKRVAGADTPRALSRYITTIGWKPVNTDIRVTDPVRLARTLGGANLYGDNKLVPLRELVQNGVDAVRARRKLEDRSQDWGSVKISLSKKSESDDKVWLHVDDTGVGMSERMITESLLDFGTSSWNSSMIQEEFPGLESKGINPIGKFGIGFFSVFLLGSHVEVITKKYKGNDLAKLLSFSGLGRKPILREADESEVPLDYSTRISVCIEQPTKFFEEIEIRSSIGLESSRGVYVEDFLRQMFSAVDVQIEYFDSVHKKKFLHSPDWLKSDPVEFLKSLCMINEENSWFIEPTIEAHASLLRPLVGDDGVVYGRAAINIVPGLHRHRGTELSKISVGGFVVEEDGVNRDISYIGVLAGEAMVASRETAVISVPRKIISSWASEQVKLLDSQRLHPQDLLPVCHSLLSLDADTLNLPFCLKEKSLISFREFKVWLAGQQALKMPLIVMIQSFEIDDDGPKEFKYAGLDSVAQDVLFYGMRQSFICLTNSSDATLRIDPTNSQIEEAEKNSLVSVRKGLESIESVVIRWAASIREVLHVDRREPCPV